MTKNLHLPTAQTILAYRDHSISSRALSLMLTPKLKQIQFDERYLTADWINRDRDGWRRSAFTQWRMTVSREILAASYTASMSSPRNHSRRHYPGYIRGSTCLVHSCSMEKFITVKPTFDQSDCKPIGREWTRRVVRYTWYGTIEKSLACLRAYASCQYYLNLKLMGNCRAILFIHWQKTEANTLSQDFGETGPDDSIRKQKTNPMVME